MYSARQYRSDLKKAWNPVKKSSATFGRKFRTLEPFAYFGPCIVLCARILWFILQFTFLTGRRLANK